MRILKCLLIAGMLLVGTPACFGQAFKDAIGFNDLVDKYGDSLADGASIRASMVEAPNNSNNHFPDVNSPELQDKTVWDGTGGRTNVSGHASRVSRTLVGNTTSLTPGVADLTVFEANDWIDRITGYENGGDPLQQVNGNGDLFHVQNHSYIGNGYTDAEATDILQRLDFMVNRDNSTIVVGTNNAGGLPDLLVNGYNTITVGRTTGNHANGTTSFYGSGRVKPEIVAPEGATSWATPMVGSAAILLRDTATGNGNQNEVIKALLLGGATKEEFSSWSRTSTRPLDTNRGAGELNIFNSYEMLLAGEQDGSSIELGVEVMEYGWDYESGIDDGESRYYTIDSTGDIEDLSVLLTWNINVQDDDPSAGVFSASTFLADLNMELYDSAGNVLGDLIDSSVSTEHNVEHIYLESLAAGRYTLRVSNDSGVVGLQDYGLAWRFSVIPEPTGGVAMILLSLAFIRRRRKS